MPTINKININNSMTGLDITKAIQEATNRYNTTASTINKNEQIEAEEFDIIPNAESSNNTPINSKSPTNTDPPENLSGSVEDLPENIDYYDKITDDGFTPQGYSYVSNDEYQKIFITAYNHDGENSRIYVYDTEGNYEGYIVLNSKNHVGGITYDTDNNIVFVTASNGKVETYNYDMLIDIFEGTEKNGEEGAIVRLDFENISNEKKRKDAYNNYVATFIENDISVLDEVNEGRWLNKQQGMDSIYYHDGKIYSTTYESDGKLVETSYSISTENGKKVITENTSEVIANIGPAVQGIAFYEENGEEYLITASSAAGASSLLTKFKINENGEYELVGYQDIGRSGLEGIYIDDQGNITGIFEYDKIEESDDNYQLTNIDDINKDPYATLDGTFGQGNAPLNISDLRGLLETEAGLWDAIHHLDTNDNNINDHVYYDINGMPHPK